MPRPDNVLSGAASTRYAEGPTAAGIPLALPDWLTRLSELPELLGRPPVRSELTYHLVRLDKEYTEAGSAQPWEQYYAERLVALFV
ncbi:MAG: hypothetical protein ACR2JU_02555 [Nocardioidaceae bacterium]